MGRKMIIAPYSPFLIEITCHLGCRIEEKVYTTSAQKDDRNSN
jgi:hypothetical protein